MTFTKLQDTLVGAIRSVRRVYRRADTAGEKLERELDRLINRKRLVQPDDLITAIKVFNTYEAAVRQISAALVDAGRILNTPLI